MGNGHLASARDRCHAQHRRSRWSVGSEGSGLRRLIREKCDVLVSLPMHGQVESLTAAVEGSIG
jgi:tRNA G18 (ribose-2'-O)-methylase SpoU